MSRYDYRDPGTDQAYCDRISGDGEQPRQELCPNCKGDGVTWNHVEGGYLEKVPCGDCGGKGYCEEEL